MEVAFATGIAVSITILFTWMNLFQCLIRVKRIHRWTNLTKIILYTSFILLLSYLLHITWYNSVLWTAWVIGSEILLGNWRHRASTLVFLAIVLLGFGIACLVELLRSISDGVYFLWIGFFGGTCLIYIGMGHALRIIIQVRDSLQESESNIISPR